MVLKTTICVVLLVAHTTLAIDKKPKPMLYGGKPLYLFHISQPQKHTLVKATDKLMPHRLYLVFVEELGAYSYSFTNFSAKFPVPGEYLRGLSVFSGKYVGAKEPDLRYLFKSQEEWKTTNLPEQYYFWVLTDPPRVKTVGFKPIK